MKYLHGACQTVKVKYEIKFLLPTLLPQFRRLKVAYTDAFFNT